MGYTRGVVDVPHGGGPAVGIQKKETSMVSEKVTLVNPQGLHMRPAGLFASTMGKFACDVTVVTPEKEVNGKSPMALMAAGIPCGTEVEIRADALTTAIELIKSGLGE